MRRNKEKGKEVNECVGYDTNYNPMLKLSPSCLEYLSCETVVP